MFGNKAYYIVSYMNQHKPGCYAKASIRLLAFDKFDALSECIRMHPGCKVIDAKPSMRSTDVGVTYINNVIYVNFKTKTILKRGA
jgi:hypothetical protein